MTYTSESLMVVNSFPEIEELTAAQYNGRHERPGFQIHEDLVRRVGLFAIFDSINNTTFAQGHSLPFNSKSAESVNDNHLPPHIDGSLIGLAIHHSLSSHGTVQLAHLKDKTFQPGKRGSIFAAPYQKNQCQYTGQGIQDIKEADTIHSGTLHLNRLTVFSEGNVEGLPPAIHYFGDGKNRRWARYAHNPLILSTPEREVAAIDGFRNEVRNVRPELVDPQK